MDVAKRGYKLQEFVAHASDVNCLKIGKKSCRVFLTGGVDRKVNLWEIGKPTSLLSLSGHTSSVESVTFDSTEVFVLAGAYNGTIKLWDLEEAKIVRTLTGHRASCTTVEFHPFGEFFASGSSDTDLMIWDIRKKGCIHTYKGHTQGIRTIRFTPDGRWVVSGGEDNVIKLWDLTAGKLLHEFKFHSGQIQSIDFHPHEFLLVTGSADRTVKFWDLETFELIGSAGPEATGVRSMIFHPDGKSLFCGLDETLKVFSWEPIRCHDAVDMGWSILGDLSICEGKLLGCSYHQSSVRVWVADISLIRPYAVGIVPRSSGLLEPTFNPGAGHSFHQIDAGIKSNTTLINREQDCGNEAKETVKSVYVTSKDDAESAPQSFNSMSASKITPRSSTGSRGNKGTSSCHIVSQNFNANIASKESTPKLTARREIKSTESCSSTPRKTESSFASKRTTLSSTGFSGSSLLDRKNSMEVRRGTNIQVMNRPLSTPAIVPRESPDLQNSVNLREKKMSTGTDGHGTTLSKPTHTRKPSYVSGGTEDQLTETESESKSGTGNCLSGLMDSDLLLKLVVNDESAAAIEGPAADKFTRIVPLDRSSVSHDSKCTKSLCATTKADSVIVKGVAIRHGRTRSLVESWERREIISGSFKAAINSSSNITPETANLSSNLNEQIQTSERDLTSEDDDCGPDVLLQTHDLFVNVLKSRLTKLQVVRHFWEQNGIKGAINAVGKLPDHSVQIDLISILMEKIDLFTLDLFSLLLPLLAGLISTKTERHTDVSLEMLLKLVRVFGPVIRSTLSASSSVGVDIEAEQRLDRCRVCFNQLEKIKQVLPSLIRKGGSIAKHAVELNLTLQE